MSAAFDNAINGEALETTPGIARSYCFSLAVYQRRGRLRVKENARR